MSVCARAGACVQVEDEVMRKVVKETQDRVRLFEEKQRRWQQEQLQSPPMTQ